MRKNYQFYLRRHPTINSQPSSIKSVQNPMEDELIYINHPLHFCLTIVTFSLWGIVWWRLILMSRGEKSFFSGLDDDYWSYLIERERPPAALYELKIGEAEHQQVFEA